MYAQVFFLAFAQFGGNCPAGCRHGHIVIQTADVALFTGFASHGGREIPALMHKPDCLPKRGSVYAGTRTTSQPSSMTGLAALLVMPAGET